MFVKLRKVDLLNVSEDFDNFFSGEKCLIMHSLKTMHNVNYHENKLRGTGGGKFTPVNAQRNTMVNITITKTILPTGGMDGCMFEQLNGTVKISWR
jgi:hypothetical protein